MSKLEPITITAAGRDELERLVRDRNTAQKVVWRARIVLLAADGMAAGAIAAATGKSQLTVRRWRRRFLAKGLDALLKDASRPPRRKPLTAEKIAEVVHMTLHTKPPNATHWSVRSMAAAVGLSPSSIQRIWSAHGLKPHLTKTFKLSNDKQFVEKVKDVVGLYLDPPDKALVLSLDEKSQIQALDRTQPGLPMKKGRAGTWTHDYKRHGTTTLFAALNVATGKVIGQCMKRHRHQEWLKFLRAIDRATPKALDLHLIADNYATHKHPTVKAWLAKHPRFHMHFTPTSASWINQVERFFGLITDQRIRRGVFKSVGELETAIMDYLDQHNAHPKPFVWTKSSGEILEKVARAKQALESQHYNATIQVTDSSTGSGPYHASITYQLPTTQQVPVAAAVTSTTPANIRDAINVGASVTGPITSVAVATNPSHGTAVPSGVNIVYTPTTNYFGTDSFTYTATGPGGTSAPATVTVTVTPLAVPVVQPLTAQVLATTPVTLNATAGAANGPFTAVTITTAPSAGTAVVAGQNIVYTPASSQTVSANITFTYTVSNAFGTSVPGTVTITVNPIPVPPPTQTVVTPPVSPTSQPTVSVSITDGAQGGPFVSATLVTVSPPDAGTVTLVPVNTQTGSIAPLHLFAEAFGIKPAAAATVTVAGHAFNVVFVPNPSFVGTVTVTYTLANAFAASAEGQVLFVVSPRPDVSADANVVGLITAQIEEARRFATAQIGNFNQRLEALHGEGPARSSNGLSVNFGDRATSVAATDPDENPLTRGTADVHHLNRNDAHNRNTDPTQDPKARHDGGGDGESILPRDLAFWTAGSVDFGSRSSTAQRTGFNFTTDGVSAGADYRLSREFTVGIGGGYGHDQSDIGTDGTKSIADSYNAAIYGSYHPSTETFIDGVLGYGWLNYDSTRLITATTDFARGHRNGEQSFGSLTAGYEYKTDTFRVTPYGRFDYSDSTLDRFSESALGQAALTYFSQSVTTTTATLGLKGDLAVPLDWALFLPFLRVELQHDFQGTTRAGLAYADLASAGPAYYVPGAPVDRNHMQLGIGANLKVGTYTFGLGFENTFGIHEEQNSQVRLLATSHF